MTTNPFQPEKRSGYWILVDTRSGEIASYPTTKANCELEAATMNTAYREALEHRA